MTAATTRATHLAVAVAAALLAAACSESISPDPIGDYTQWYSVEASGAVPGHGDTIRVIYANDAAREYTGAQYPDGSILVKEIYDNAGGQRGALRYVALMRKQGPPGQALADEGGWLFSMSSTPGSAETHSPLCWTRCHVAAPFDGAWLDYSPR